MYATSLREDPDCVVPWEEEEADAPTCNSNAKMPPFLEKNLQRRVWLELKQYASNSVCVCVSIISDVQLNIKRTLQLGENLPHACKNRLQPQEALH